MIRPPRDLVASTEAGLEGQPVVPHELVRDTRGIMPETPEEAEEQGPDEDARFWKRQIEAALVHERRFRAEAVHCENLYFGEDNDVAQSRSGDAAALNLVSDEVALIHANVDVLKPMIFSETPQPVVRRRWRGDGRFDETDLMAAEAAQRIATYMLDVEDFDGAMMGARDDWLIVGRGSARAIYKMETGQKPGPDGLPVEAKTSERVCPRHSEWRRTLYAPASSWHDMPWIAFEVPLTRSKIEKRFPAHAGRFAYNQKGLIDKGKAISDDDRETGGFASMPSDESGAPVPSPFDTAMVWEIWCRDTKEVIWWSPAAPGAILDRVPDPLHLEDFYPSPKPLLATTRSASMTPRSDIRYYERRAKEIDKASKKLASILEVISISGLFPGDMASEVQKLLDGTNKMIPVAAWLKFLEKGGATSIIQWLPLKDIIVAAQALVQMREQARQAMFEASGVSDIMRAQGDPNETATAQQLKGRYAGLRLSERQRRMALFALDLLRIMVEIAFEHFDTATLAEIAGLDLPMTEAERQAAIQRQQMTQALYAKMVEANQMAEAEGVAVQPLPPPPEEVKIPATSWELVHDRLRSDFKRKITVSIETQSTVLADETSDKEARIEFLNAFASLTSTLVPLAMGGQIDMKTVKELLMFGVRGFPKSRTIESHIANLPDEPPVTPQQQEDTAITVAKIKAETDLQIEQMRLADKEAERAHEMRLKGVGLIADAEKAKAETANEPPPTEDTREDEEP